MDFFDLSCFCSFCVSRKHSYIHIFLLNSVYPLNKLEFNARYYLLPCLGPQTTPSRSLFLLLSSD